MALLKENETKLLNFIKFSPLIFISIIAVIINILIYGQNQIHFEQEVQKAQKDFIHTQKIIVKNHVENAYQDIINEKNSIEKRLKNQIKQKVYEAYAIVENLYEEHKHEGKERVLKIIKDALRNIRFNDGRGYIFIDHKSGVKILQPIHPQFEGQNFLHFKDPKGYEFVQTISKTIENNEERFDSYYWYKPNNKDEIFKKISFYKTFKPLDFAIGTGEYIDDFTDELKEKILHKYIHNERQNDNNYLFIVQYDGVYLAHIKKEYVGKNRIKLTDKYGNKISQLIVDTAKAGEGYVRYFGTIMPQTGKPAMKTTFVKGLQEWNWAIAAGFYDKELQLLLKQKEDELIEKNRQYMKKIFFVSLILTALLILVTIYISKILRNSFFEYKQQIIQGINENKAKDKILYQQAKMAAMGEMLANIAHQWRQPLSLISSVASGMKVQKELNIDNREDEIKSYDMILKQVRYLSTTIDDFRNYFRPDKEKTTLNIREVFDKTFQLIDLKSKGIRVVQHIQDIELKALENELIQVLINILNNAKDALQDKSDKIIIINVEKHKESMIISIHDSAGGIDEAIQNRIFEPYFTTKHKAQGTGIGLYMVEEILTRHMGASVEVKNSEFEFEKATYSGAEFIITFNLEDNKA